jgi:hypothetical protein
MKGNHGLIAEIVLLSAVMTGMVSTTLAGEPTQPPNIIIFLTDDQGYTDAGVYGSNDLDTPNIDEAARCLDIATPAQVDAIACEFLGVGLRPFAVMNLVSLTVMAAASRNLAVLGKGYQASLELQKRSTSPEPNRVISEAAECQPAVQLAVKDRLLGAMIYPGKDIQEQNLCSRDDLHVICKEALGYGRSSVEHLESLDPSEIDRLISIYLSGQE